MAITRAQARDVDRRASERFSIPGIVLMENASRGVADVVVDELRSMAIAVPARILILCGGGNNGGDGLAAARHLHLRGHAVRIGLTSDPARYAGDAGLNWAIIQAMSLAVFQATPEAIRLEKSDLIIDAIFGTGLTQPPRDPFPAIVAAIESTGILVVSVDLPSGLDCDTGFPLGVAIKARRTVTFVDEKIGFANPASRQYTGSVTVAAIGCPT
jgi:NAD(P)H-hydrate epimerase